MDQDTSPAGRSSDPLGGHFDPTPEGWAAFREAIRKVLAIPDDGRFIAYPILGTFDYHYRPPAETRIADVTVTAEEIRLRLDDGRTVSAPLAWFPILRDATPEERSTFEVTARRTLVEFPLLNTEVAVEQLLVCHDGCDEQAFLGMCARDDRLIADVAVLVERAARLNGLTLDEVLRAVEREVLRITGQGRGSSEERSTPRP